MAVNNVNKKRYVYPRGVKLCTRCGEMRPIDEFLNDSYREGKLVGYCTSCRSRVSSENALSGNRIRALEKTGGKCALCGSDEKINVHHITPKTRHGTDDLDNLIPLCKSCHLKAHNGNFSNYIEHEKLIAMISMRSTPTHVLSKMSQPVLE